MTDVMQLRVASEVADTNAEGPGVRYAVWLQGCPMRCPGCCNPALLPFRGGSMLRVRDLTERVLTSNAEGLSLLGGEPFAQAEAAARLCEQLRDAGRSVVVFSGYARDEIERMGEDARRLLNATDLLIDGRYDQTRPDRERRWVGSTNQVVHHLSDRYDAEDPAFFASDTLELRVRDGQVIVNGRPWGRALP